MKTRLQKAAITSLLALPYMLAAQVDLTIGINYSYDPPTNCNNQIKNIAVDVCNGGSSSAGSFLVGIYLYNPNTSDKWVIDQKTVSSLSGNDCVTLDNWNIDMNNYCCLPGPASNYRIGVWADTANVITETSESNNASLLSGNIQVCASSVGLNDITEISNSFNVSPHPVITESQLKFRLPKEEKVLISLFDITGKNVQVVYTGALNQGDQTIYLPTTDLASGVYILKLTIGGNELHKKLIVQK